MIQESITAYNILMLAHPEGDIYTLGNILHTKKNELTELIEEMPALQRTPLGIYCRDLAHYRWRLLRAVGEGNSRKNYLREQVSRELQSNPEGTKQLCKILGFNPEAPTH